MAFRLFKFSVAAASVALVLFAWGVLAHRFGEYQAKLMLSAIAVSFGTILAALYVAEPRPRTWIRRTGLTFIVLSQAAFLLIVWTRWREQQLPWQIWWATAIPSLAGAHVLVLQRAGAHWRDFWGRMAAISIPLHALFWIGLVARRHILEDPPTWYLVPLVASGAAAFLSSDVIAARWWRARRAGPVTLPAWTKYTLFAGAQALLFFGGIYIGRITMPREPAWDAFPSALAAIPHAELDQQVRADFGRFRTLAQGMDELTAKAGAMDAEIQNTLRAQNRAFLTPAEDDRVRSMFLTFLSYRSALLRFAAFYGGFEAVHDPLLKARCFLLAYGAATLLYESSGRLVQAYRDFDLARRKLNEPDPRWGIPAGMFDRIAESITLERNVERFEEMAAYFDDRRAGWLAAEVYPPADFEWLDGRVRRGIQAVRSLSINRHGEWLKRMLSRVKDDAYSPVYAVQSSLSEWIGDTRIVGRPPLISHDQIHAVQPRLKPGDIIIERRNWFLSNAFLPGFWPHSALYVGTMEDLKRLKLTDVPAVRAKLEAYQRPADDGQPCTVIEAVSEGVVFNSLTHSLHADYVAVLRPRLRDDQIAQAIATAFSHHGKPYDFEFDFFTSDKLVCTEVVYRSYEGLIHFDLVHVMGRDTLPALEIVRKFSRERFQENRELDFVVFLDGKPAEGKAVEAGVEEFCGSADRPREFHE